MSEKLTLQLYHQHHWLDVAELMIVEPNKGRTGRCELNYEVAHLPYFNDRGETAISFCYPVETFGYRKSSWFRFIEDIMPSGSSRDYWVRKLGLDHLSFTEQDFILFKKGTIAPIGNIRLKESLPEKVENDFDIQFTVEQVAERDVNFIEYAQENGAAAGGATGAGGAAPKLLLRSTANNMVWIDTFQDEPENLDQHYLVKFPRGKSDIDKDILRAEYHFYHELSALGFNTISIEQMKLLEGSRMPSLWLPRFDVYEKDGKMQRQGMESVYSIIDEGEAKPMWHGDVIAKLIKVMKEEEYFGTTRTLFDEPDGIKQFVIEWVRRDLLNIAFGNSDNHGRNTSFIKDNNLVTLAPIYDFAPMKADPEVVTRTFTWGTNLERGGEYNFPLIAQSLAKWVDPEELLAAIGKTAQQLINLKERLIHRGVPESIVEYQSIGYANLERKFKNWGLIR